MFLWKNTLWNTEKKSYGNIPVFKAIKEKKPKIQWTGGKITENQWYQMLSFFRTNNKEECQLKFFYNPKKEIWDLIALPQIKNGMTTKEIEDHEDREKQLKNYNSDWVMFGTAHHHCNSGAFQSGTDEKDEVEIPGLHITIGKINDEIIEIDVRYSEKGIIIDANIMDFVDVSRKILLKDNTFYVKYPDFWNKNIYEKPKTTTYYPAKTYGQYPYDEYPYKSPIEKWKKEEKEKEEKDYKWESETFTRREVMVLIGDAEEEYQGEYFDLLEELEKGGALDEDLKDNADYLWETERAGEKESK